MWPKPEHLMTKAEKIVVLTAVIEQRIALGAPSGDEALLRAQALLAELGAL